MDELTIKARKSIRDIRIKSMINAYARKYCLTEIEVLEILLEYYKRKAKNEITNKDSNTFKSSNKEK